MGMCVGISWAVEPGGRCGAAGGCQAGSAELLWAARASCVSGICCLLRAVPIKIPVQPSLLYQWPPNWMCLQLTCSLFGAWLAREVKTSFSLSCGVWDGISALISPVPCCGFTEILFKTGHWYCCWFSSMSLLIEILYIQLYASLFSWFCSFGLF